VPLFIEQVWNAQKMQTLLGHASINMTMDVYGHLFEKLENFFGGLEELPVKSRNPRLLGLPHIS
jgi:hypothetical protein